MLLRTAKSCVPDAPTLASSLAEFCRPNRAMTKRYPQGDGGKRARSPGRARHKPLKPLRAGMPGVPVYSLLLVCVLPIQSAHETAGAVGTRHSPRPPLGRKINARLGRTAPRGCRFTFRRHCEERSDEAIHTFFAASMHCFAELVIRRAFARPVGSQ